MLGRVITALDCTWLYYTANTMVADDLAMQGAKPSTAILLI